MLQKSVFPLLLLILSLKPVLSQTKPAGAATSPLCTKDNALEMIRQQVDVSKYVNWVPAGVHILEGLIRLEPDVRKSLPDLLRH